MNTESTDLCLPSNEARLGQNSLDSSRLYPSLGGANGMPRPCNDHDQFSKTMTSDSLRVLRRQLREQGKILPRSVENPKIGKKLSPVPNLLKMYRKRVSVKAAAIEKSKAISHRTGSPDPLSDGDQMRVNLDADVLSQSGGETNTLQSSLPYNVILDPPRFSQLLTQASLPESGPPVISTRSSKSGMVTRKSTVTRESRSVYRRPHPQPTVTVPHDRHQGMALPVGETNLREQIVACLLDPDFEDFVAEVEKVWDELEG